MKKLLLSMCLVSGFAMSSSAQFELKTNPVGLVLNWYSMQGEFLLNDEHGIQVGMNTFEGVQGIYKYYLNPKRGADNFNIGMYAQGNKSAQSFGFYSGWKLVSKRNVVIEVGAGVGRLRKSVNPETIIRPNKISGTVQLNVGYRFDFRGKK